MNSLQQNDKNSTSLKVHEWLAISLFIGMLGSLALITTFYQDKVQFQVEAPSKSKIEGFDVLIKGAVRNPGIYHVNTQMQMKDVLALAEPLSEADLRKYQLESYITKGRVINVPTRTMLTIHVEGAVKGDKKFIVPKGTKVQDLLSLVELEENADIEVLLKKRKLMNNEVIVVPIAP